MSELTEREILDCLKTNLRLAAEDAEKLARRERGPVYVRFRDELKLVEGCCRQMAGWREDTRWLPFGVKIAEARLRTGQWLREKQPGWRFQGLAEILREALKRAIELETKRTGKLGVILPEMMPGEHRDTRPIAVPAAYADIKPSGLLDAKGQSIASTVH